MFSRGINEYCVQNLRNLPADSSGAVFRSLRVALPRSTKHCDSGENGVSLIGRFPLCTENEPKVVIKDNLNSRLEYVHYVCSTPSARMPTFDNLNDCCKGGRSRSPAPFLQRHVHLRMQPFRHLGSKIKDSKGLRTPVLFAPRRATGNTTYILSRYQAMHLVRGLAAQTALARVWISYTQLLCICTWRTIVFINF